ncbi:NADH-quinone oxidoreductase subunit NuoK [Pantoea sp. Mhis]|uniref:NADH-quinone oxidoreductase subunit NuoK n=1 Tax=Pantoea sp. Mhis TaxID=2576759 RepID=UPI001357B57D|nr:NADH-quinone oxidoreductase subunit NuoK [Pantoea sp. Mhis]MXP56100.1 NADH-quinone oxidoreductase subunit NuoK [Pantoea sp. Mhis]
MVPLQHGLILSTVLFILGLSCLILRRNLMFILAGIEIMLNSASLLIVIVSSYFRQVDGQIMYIITISVAAVEASIGLIILLKFYHFRQTLDVDTASEMHG